MVKGLTPDQASRFYDRLSGLIREQQQVTGTVPLHAPDISDHEKQRVLACLDSGWISTAGPWRSEFEQKLINITGHKHAIAVNSGTAALHLAFNSLTITTSDVVLCPAISFAATANAIAHAGARPVFLDIDPATLTLDAGTFRDFLEQNATVRQGQCYLNSGERIAALVAVHVFGYPARLDAITQICTDWKIPLVEDAAEALGSNNNGNHCGHHGQISVLSFNGNKIVTTGAGGAVLTNCDKTAAVIRHRANTARHQNGLEAQDHDYCGWNYLMPSLNASLGLAQLERLPVLLAEKRRWHDQVAALLTDIPGAFFGHSCLATDPNHWLLGIRFDAKETAQAFIRQANRDDLQYRPLWRPLNRLSAFTGQEEQCPGADHAADCWVNIPSSALLGRSHQP